MLKVGGFEAQSCTSLQHLNRLEVHFMKLGVPLASLKMGSLCCLKRFPSPPKSQWRAMPVCVYCSNYFQTSPWILLASLFYPLLSIYGRQRY